MRDPGVIIGDEGPTDRVPRPLVGPPGRRTPALLTGDPALRLGSVTREFLRGRFRLHTLWAPWRQLLPWPEAGGLSSPLSPPEPAARARFTRPRSSGSRRRRRRAPTSPGPLQRSSASRTMRSYSVVKLASLSFGRNLRVRKGRGARPVGDASASETPVALRAPSISEESSACIPVGERFIQLHSSALYIKLNGSPCLTIIDTEGFAPPQEDHQQRVARRKRARGPQRCLLISSST